MTVTVNTSTENFRTDTTSPLVFSHAAASSGVKGALLFLMHGTSSTDHVSAASYGGVSMTRIRREATAGAGEAGASEVWFLGASIPQGTQDFSYTPGSTTDDIYAVGITLLAALDTESIDNDGINSTSQADPSVTLQYTSREAMAFAGLWDAESSVVDVFTENGNCTRIHSQDSVAGTSFGVVFRQTTAGTSDFAIGGTVLGDELAYVALAIAEVSGSSFTLVVDHAQATGQGQSSTFPIGLLPINGQATLQPFDVVLLFDQAFVLPVDHQQLVLESQQIPFILAQVGNHGQFVGQGQDVALLSVAVLLVDAGQYTGQGQTVILTTALPFLYGQAVLENSNINLTYSGAPTIAVKQKKTNLIRLFQSVT